MWTAESTATQCMNRMRLYESEVLSHDGVVTMGTVLSVKISGVRREGR